MLDVLGSISKYFKLSEVNIDSWIWKLHYKVSAAIFLAGSLVGVASKYFGEPISCNFNGKVDSQLARDYCWIHGSNYIDEIYQKHMKCTVSQREISSPEDAPDTSYYQWVSFVLFLQAAFFVLPYKMWKFAEGNLIRAFGSKANTPVIDYESDASRDVEALIDRYVNYFYALFRKSGPYFWKYFFCETLNLVFVIANFFITDNFLNGNFFNYGIDAWAYYSKSPEVRAEYANPLCTTFPTEVSCTIPIIGASGGESTVNAICVLSHNIVNEKIYLIIWFWLVTLIIVSFMTFLYRLATIFFPALRFMIIFAKIRTDFKMIEDLVKNKCEIGDWFLLVQISKNSNPYFFRKFVQKLHRKLGNEESAKYCLEPNFIEMDGSGL